MARGSSALQVDRSLPDGWRVHQIRSGRRSARARHSDQAWIGTGTSDSKRLRHVFAARARRSCVLRLCSGDRTRARPRGIIEQRRRWTTSRASASDGRWTMAPGSADCSRDGARPGADGAGRIRARVNGALLADGAGFRPSAPRTRRVVRARRLGRRISSICSRAQRDAACRVSSRAGSERHGHSACAQPWVCRRPDTATPRVGIGRCHTRHRGRRAPGHRSCPDRRAFASRDICARTDERVHHVRRHLLRGHVWRVHHQHPAEYPGRDGVDRHCHRRPHDGAPGPRCGSADDRGHRIVRGRHACHAGTGVLRAASGIGRACVSARPSTSR